jgi:choline dehydrogenase-like flavoprotein
MLASLGIDGRRRPARGRRRTCRTTSPLESPSARSVKVSIAFGTVLRFACCATSRLEGAAHLERREGFGFVRSSGASTLPDLELLFVPSLFINEGLRSRSTPRSDPRRGAPRSQLSRGHVTITSPDPTDAPEIDPAYLSDPGASTPRTLARASDLPRIAAAPSLKSEITELVQPAGRSTRRPSSRRSATSPRPSTTPSGRVAWVDDPESSSTRTSASAASSACGSSTPR